MAVASEDDELGSVAADELHELVGGGAEAQVIRCFDAELLDLGSVELETFRPGPVCLGKRLAEAVSSAAGTLHARGLRRRRRPLCVSQSLDLTVKLCSRRGCPGFLPGPCPLPEDLPFLRPGPDPRPAAPPRSTQRWKARK